MAGGTIRPRHRLWIQLSVIDAMTLLDVEAHGYWAEHPPLHMLVAPFGAGQGQEAESHGLSGEASGSVRRRDRIHHCSRSSPGWFRGHAGLAPAVLDFRIEAPTTAGY
jgi:hypothetical protein